MLFPQLWDLIPKLFWYSISFALLYDFRIKIFNLSKMTSGIFMVITLNLKINLTPEQSMYLLLFRSLLLFLNNIIWFSLHMYFTYFVIFIPNCFLFWCFGKWYYFTISNCSLIVYINANDFVYWSHILQIC